MRFKVFFILFLNLSALLFAQKEEAVPQEMVVVDSLMGEYAHGVDTDSLSKTKFTTENIVFPKKIAENYRKNYQSKEFNYSEVRPQESLWSKLKRRFTKIWESIFGKVGKTVDGLEFGLKLLAILVVATAVFFIAKYLLNKDGNFFWSRKNKKVNITSGVLHENIHEINFPTTILELEKRKDYRFAIRYQFLFALKKLSDQKLIQWNPDKTNTDYISEIKDDVQKIAYQELSYIFENVWYGEQRVDGDLYEKLKATFLKTNFTNNKL